MREIKFRIWDGEEFLPLSRALCTDLIGVQSDSTRLESYYENVCIEQFTGLKDKTGKEIYEGDVVKRDFRVFLNGKLKDSDIRYITVTIPEIYFDLKGSIEIIGTIHEKDEIPY